MIYFDDIDQTVPANVSALPAVAVPEGTKEVGAAGWAALQIGACCACGRGWLTFVVPAMPWAVHGGSATDDALLLTPAPAADWLGVQQRRQPVCVHQ
jgi:hypothetical protein